MEPNGVLLDKPLFGGKIIVILYDVDETFGKEILDETYEFALKLQKTFNFYDNESELSILNKKRKLTVSHDLLHVIKNALGFCRLTEGQYDISLGKNILEKKGAFDTLNELKNLPPALKEERKLLRIKEGLKDRREDDKISRQHFKTKRRSN